MNKTDLSKIIVGFRAGIRKNAPAIAIGVGIASFGYAVMSAYKEGPKVEKLINAKKEELNLKNDEKLPAKEAIKATWKCYLPSVVSFGTGIVCILGAHQIDARRNAALAAAYQLSESAFREYKNKVIETIGEKQEKVIKSEVVKDKIRENPPVQSSIIVTGKGETRFYDGQMDRYFKSDIETIRKIVNSLNYRMMSEQYISLNEFYYELGLPQTDTGDMLGWNIDHGLIEVDFVPVLPEDGIPTVAIKYMVGPKYDYIMR